MPKLSSLLLSAAALSLALAAGSATAHSYQAGPLKIGHPWTRPTPPSAPTAVGYLTVTNTGSAADKLLGGESTAVDHVEIHQMSMDGGVMRMRPVTGGIEIAPGKTVALEPGGYHLMLIGPKQPFKLGDRIPGVLKFEHQGSVKVEFVVQAEAPAEGAGGMASMPGMKP